MAANQTVWGIDVGRCALKAIKLRTLTDGLVEVLGHAYIEHDQILTESGADQDLKITAALEKFLAQNDISGDQVVVGIPGENTLARYTNLPPVEAKKIPDLVKFEAGQQIPFDMDEVIWDYQIFQEEGSPDINVGIFAVKRDVIRNYLTHFEAAGIEPLFVQAAPMALYSAARFDGMVDDGVSIILNIGTGHTDMVIAGADTLSSRTIRIGGNAFTQSLVNAFKLSFSKAESLKRGAATSKYARRIFQAMRPVFADLVQELQRSIGHYTSAHRDVEFTRVIGLGSAFNLPVLQKFIQQNLQLDVVCPNSYEKMQFGPGVNEEELKPVLPTFGVAYGLALQGLGLAKMETNLLPIEMARQVLWRKKRPWFGAAAACVLLASGLIWMRNYKDEGTLSNAGKDASPVASVEQAQQILASSQSAGAPRQKATQIRNAAKTLKQEYDKASRGGQAEIAKIEAVKKLAENKTILPRILEIVHKSIPGAELGAEVQSAKDYAEAVSNLGKREDRQIIHVQSLNFDYCENLNTEVVNELMIPRILNRGSEEPPPGPSKPGFVFQLECRTPYGDVDAAQVVVQPFIERLKKSFEVPDQGFYVNRIVESSQSRFSAQDVKSKNSRSPSRPNTPGLPGLPGLPGGGKQKPPTQPKKAPSTVAGEFDVLTDEAMKNDWVFTIVFEVVLDNLPENYGEQGTPPASSPPNNNNQGSGRPPGRPPGRA